MIMRSRPAFILLFVCAVIFVGSVISLAPLLPERLATHFGASGQADGWMTRAQHLRAIILLGFGVPALVTGLCFAIRFFPASMLNVPKADYWRSAEHYPVACSILLNWSFFFGALSFLWTAGLNYQIVAANRVTPPHLAPGPVFLLVGLYLAATLVMVVLLVLRFTKPRGEGNLLP